MTSTIPLRAHLRRPGEIHLGLGSDAAVVLSGLTEAETRTVVALGPMTARQWGSAHLARPPRLGGPPCFSCSAMQPVRSEHPPRTSVAS